jgi:hypothetical protein
MEEVRRQIAALHSRSSEARPGSLPSRCNVRRRRRATVQRELQPSWLELSMFQARSGGRHTGPRRQHSGESASHEQGSKNMPTMRHAAMFHCGFLPWHPRGALSYCSKLCSQVNSDIARFVPLISTAPHGEPQQQTTARGRRTTHERGTNQPAGRRSGTDRGFAIGDEAALERESAGVGGDASRSPAHECRHPVPRRPSFTLE